MMTPAIAPEYSKENVLRVIAHEIRQPLRTIESIAYSLSLAPPADGRHREQFLRIQQLVEQTNWVLSNGLGVAESRSAAPETIDIEELITQTIAAKPKSPGPPMRCELAADLPLVEVDPGFGHALIENLMGLFRQLATEAHPVRLRTSTDQEGIEIELSTGAAGYRTLESLPRGSALSLECARRVVEMHGGSLDFSIDPTTGIRVQVMLP